MFGHLSCFCCFIGRTVWRPVSCHLLRCWTKWLSLFYFCHLWIVTWQMRAPHSSSYAKFLCFGCPTQDRCTAHVLYLPLGGFGVHSRCHPISISQSFTLMDLQVKGTPDSCQVWLRSISSSLGMPRNAPPPERLAAGTQDCCKLLRFMNHEWVGATVCKTCRRRHGR